MWRPVSELAALVFLGAVCTGNLGCALFEGQCNSLMYQASLNDGRSVSLWQHRQQNMVLRGPEYNYAALCLSVVCEESDSRVGGVVARRGAETWDKAPTFRFGQLEARADRSGERVWIVDTEANRVIASLDCRSGASTGPDDEPPRWATPGGGVLLGEIERGAGSLRDAIRLESTEIDTDT